ncbi:hypothetical protein HGO34_00010 [Agrobacterium vitis]|uniref:Nucleoside 2-deoxyribosyltransferase n=1 Tax=Agrobacterium vitis TaxID=373 RepID=A0AAE4WB45_AGRVI|nr:hypothetical protein [Agrobacterium vitis]MCF1498782.1 hypothetical protein [Allorhizobium sp. Av2]MCM2438099.1 hypothetical protein [Agrobacterium vitis]MUZ56520.1 hypothetical protein [Agrobacterium vitis]MVA64343.1 hypothetical protein [Agrobacterium vitis]MVA85315.1 hypothetical protein [Agrobacterium vitis]
MKKQELPKPEATADLKTCFVIMPISDVDGYPAGHFSEVYKQLIEPAVNAAGYQCSLATSTSSAHMIQLEVVTKVATADLCICDLSTNNPNVLFEYGIRQAFDKPTVLIKDDKTRRIFDLSGFRDIEYDHTLRIANTLSSREAIETAIADTVNGVGDEEQIFSLVKLMKLTKAALPAGEFTKDDARFALLEKKLDNLSSLISTTSATQTIKNHITPSMITATQKNMLRFRNGTIIIFNKDDLVIRETDGSRTTVSSIVDLENTAFWNTLGDGAKKALTAKILENSPGLMSF